MWKSGEVGDLAGNWPGMEAGGRGCLLNLKWITGDCFLDIFLNMSALHISRNINVDVYSKYNNRWFELGLRLI
jgi:hypothetical protein